MSLLDIEKQTNSQLLAKLQLENDNSEIINEKLAENKALQIEINEITDKYKDQLIKVSKMEEELMVKTSEMLELQRKETQQKVPKI